MSKACHDLMHSHRGDRGIIHVSSYKQVAQISNAILRCPACRQRLVLLRHGQRREEAITRYRDRAGSWIIHPSLGEGESFDDDLCRVQIIAKIKYPDLGNKLVGARAAEPTLGKQWYFNQAAEYTVQTSGRGMRHANDFCETFIFDGSFGQLYDRNPDAFPQWFKERLA